MASYLGAAVGDVAINDLAVHPATHQVYLSVQRGHGDDVAVLLRIDGVDGSVSEVDLVDVPTASVRLDDTPDESDERSDVTLPTDGSGEELTFGDRTIRILRRPIRMATVTDMAYVDGMLCSSPGCRTRSSRPTLRRIPFPFAARGRPTTTSRSSTCRTASGRRPRRSARSCPTRAGGASSPATRARRSCTSRSTTWSSGTQAEGRTVAELGAMNQPLDMVSFTSGGEEHLLIANSTHGLMKIAAATSTTRTALTEPKEPIGVPREVEDLQGIVKLDNLNGGYVLALQVDDAGGKHLRSLKTASL